MSDHYCLDLSSCLALLSLICNSSFLCRGNPTLYHNMTLSLSLMFLSIKDLSLSLSLSLSLRLATGSFDQQTKIWTSDGKPMLSIACSASVTGLAYLPQLRVLWVAAGTNLVNFYEPKLGANVRCVIVCVCVHMYTH